MRKFRRAKDQSVAGGVCAGLAYFLGIPPWILRVTTIALFVMYGVGLLPYLLLWLFVPKWPEGEPKDFDAVTRQ